MKNLFLIGMMLIGFYTIAQSKTATTEDGKKVILKSDNTWEYISKTEMKRKITYEFTSKDTKKQFHVGYDVLDSKTNDSGSQMSGFYNSGWKKSMYVDKMENQATLKVGIMGMGSEIVTLNIYVDDKLVKTTTAKAKSLVEGPATLTVNLEDYKK